MALLYSGPEAAASALRRMESRLGPLTAIGPALPFEWTRYYCREMGEGLEKRYFVSECLVERYLLVPLKRFAMEIERHLADEHGRRRVNIDPGLLSPENLVLASTKPRGHRLYIGAGLWGEVTLIFEKGSFRCLEWTYPDYKEPTVVEMLESARKTLLCKLRSGDYHTLKELKCSEA